MATDLPISPSDVLQADATIIAGILIMLTLSKHFFVMPDSWKILGHPKFHIVGPTCLFALSAISLTMSSLNILNLNLGNEEIAFGYLIFVAGLVWLVFLVFRVINVLSKP